MRRAERIVAKSTRNMQRDMSRVESPASRMGGGAVTRGGRAGRIGGMMGSAGSMLKGAAVMGGIYGIQGEIKKAKQFEEVLVDIAVRGQKSKAWVGDLRGKMMALSGEYGIAKDELADYVGTIIDQTGNTELAVSTLRSMTAVAYSANVPMKELAGTIVEMQSKLALSPDQFETALGILAAQADKGKVPLKDMSRYLPEVLNATVQFGHKGVGALRDYGAVLQMAARGAGSLAEANTAMNRMLDQIAAKRGKIEKTLGIKLKKNGAWLQLAPMLKVIVGGLLKMKDAGKDVEKYVTATFGIRGKKAILPLMQQAMAGWGNRVGADASGQGGLTSFDALRAAGGAGTIQDRVRRKRQLSPELDAWNKSVEKLKNKLHMHLLPAIEKLGAIMPQISSALMWMIDNWKLLLAIWAGSKMVRFLSSLTSLAGSGGGLVGKILGGAGAVGGGGGAMTGVSSVLGGGGLVGGLSVATVALGAFALSIAPAVAGLHQIAKAYDPKEQKKLREKLVKEARGGPENWMRQKLDEAMGFKGLDEGPKTQQEAWSLRVGKQYGIKKGEFGGLGASYKALKSGDYYGGATGATKFGKGRLKALSGATEADLGAVGLSKEIVNTLINAAESMTKESFKAMEARSKEAAQLAKENALFLKNLSVNGVKATIVDPNKTAAGVTIARRGKK